MGFPFNMESWCDGLDDDDDDDDGSVFIEERIEEENLPCPQRH